MPTKANGWLARDGIVYPDLNKAKIVDMGLLLRETDGSALVEEKALAMLAADLVLNQADALLAILTTGPTSRPAARKRAGTTSPKRAAKRATEAQAQAGFKAMREAIHTAEEANGLRGVVPAQPAVEAT